MPLDTSKFKDRKQLNVYTHIEENLDKKGNWNVTWIEYQEIKDKYFISKSTSLRCINEMVESGLLVKVAKGVYKLYENI